MSVSLEWTFDRDLAGFQPNQDVKLTREKIEKDYYLICQSQQTRSTPGIKLQEIVLPNNGNEFCIEVDGFANNKKSFIWVATKHGQRLFKHYTYLPELSSRDDPLGPASRVGPVIASFRLNELDTRKDHSNISIGVLIGGTAPSSNDIFFIRRIRLFEKPLEVNWSNPVTESVKITRIYEDHTQMESDLPNPSRDNDSPMNPGEYALIKCGRTFIDPSDPSDPSDNGKLFIAYSDPQLGFAVNLKYVGNLNSSNPFAGSLDLKEGESIPVYDDKKKVLEDLWDPIRRRDFYRNGSLTQKCDEIIRDKGKTYIYFDTDGFVRWINLDTNGYNDGNQDDESDSSLD